MINIFHGDDQQASRSALNQLIDHKRNSQIFRLEGKEITLELIDNIISGQTLFDTDKLIVINNFFSLPKNSLDTISKLINKNSSVDVAIWQDKKLTVAQTSIFPQALVKAFAANNLIFACSNAIKPGNLRQFASLYNSALQTESFDFLFYIIKNTIRKQLSSYSKFPEPLLKNTYLQLIELDFQNKSGQLTTDKEIALERIISNLIIHK